MRSMRSIAIAMSSSSGCTSCGGTGSSLAGEPSSMPASGLMYQSSSMPAVSGHAPLAMPSGGAKMKAERRLGCRPIGRAPASRPTTSAHAPAAFTTSGASSAWPPACTCQTPPSRRSDETGASASSAPPARRMPRRKPWWMACTSMSDASGSCTAPSTSSRRSTGVIAHAPAASSRRPRGDIACSTAQCACSGRLLAVRRDHHRAARAEHRVIGEALGRRLEEGAARPG
jgi:hypothetical protein